MRIQYILMLAVLLAVGCATKKGQRVAETIDSGDFNTSPVDLGWDERVGCDSCDSNVIGSTTIESSKLRCKTCNSQQNLLVDGSCVDCMRTQNNLPPFSGFKGPSSQAGSVYSSRKSQAPIVLGSQQAVLPNKLPKKITPPTSGPVESILGTRRIVPKAQVSQASDQVNSQLRQTQNSLLNRIESVRSGVKDDFDSGAAGLKQQANSLANKVEVNAKPFESPLSKLDEPVVRKTLDHFNIPGNEFLPESKEIVDAEPAVAESITTDAAPVEMVPPPVPTAVAVDTEPEPPAVPDAPAAIVADAEPVEEVPAKTPTKALSGAASVLIDPKSEQFDLDDLFPNLQKRQQQENSSTKTEKAPANSSSLAPGQPRDESAVISDLQNNTLSSRVVFDNTPAIAEQRLKPEDNVLVLRATPVRNYSQARQMIAESKTIQAVPKTESKFSAEPYGRSIEEQKFKRVRAIPVKSETWRSGPVQFSPLPRVQPPPQQHDLSVASPIGDEVYSPSAFPESVLQTESANKNGFEFDGPATSSTIDTDSLPVQTQRLPAVNSETEVLPFQQKVTDSVPVLLRAVPASSGIRNAVGGPYRTDSKATFRFIQPKFQRVITDDE